MKAIRTSRSLLRLWLAIIAIGFLNRAPTVEAAFVSGRWRSLTPSSSLVSSAAKTTTTTMSLRAEPEGRRWNFNEGGSPWGLKANAEIWNGRLAQMGFVIVLLQELIQGKGVIQGIQEGDPINLALVGVAVVSTMGLTIWLAIQGDDDYVARELGKK